MSTVTAGFPAESKSLRVVLSADEFTLDDQLPLVAPKPKTLKYHVEAAEKYGEITEKFGRFRNLEKVTDAASADLSFVSYDPLLPILPEGDAIVMVDETTQSQKYLRGGIVAEKHPLMDGINWQSLLVRESIQIELLQSDEVLLWQGNRPLIALRANSVFADPNERTTKRVRQLIFNFDLTLSNAANLQSTVVLLYRFSQELRDRKVAHEATNTEAGQPIKLATHQGPDADPLEYVRLGPDGSALEDGVEVIPLSQVRFLQAPEEPGFFHIKQGDEVLLESGCHFADTREADLRSCKAEDQVARVSGEAVDRHTREDHFWRLWVLLVLAALILAWHFTKDRPKDEEEPSAQPAAS